VGQRFLLDNAPTGVQHSVEIENDGDSFVAVEYTPTSIENQILDDCARKRSMFQRKSAFQHAAQIPINTYNIWKKEWRENYARTMPWSQFEVMKLNSRDNEKLRTGYKRSGSKKL
jgi:hypothetical protein